MVAFMRAAGVALLVVVPGGLLVLAAFVLARVVSERMRAQPVAEPHRLARAVASVRWSELMREARRAL